MRDPWQIFTPQRSVLYFSAATGGGSTYNDSVSDAATSAEALAQNAVLASGLTDAATAAEALTHQAVAANAHAESVTAAAAQTSGLVAVNAVLEVASASEAFTTALVALAAISDAASATDSTTGSLDQLIRPSSDTHTGDWLTSSGSGTLASHIDEAAYSDSDYIYTETPSAYCEVALQAATDPTVSTGHTLRYRARAPYDGSVKVGLYQSTTLIGEWTDALTTSFAEYSHTLAGAEADAITDYAALRLRFTALS